MSTHVLRSLVLLIWMVFVIAEFQVLPHILCSLAVFWKLIHLLSSACLVTFAIVLSSLVVRLCLPIRFTIWENLCVLSPRFNVLHNACESVKWGSVALIIFGIFIGHPIYRLGKLIEHWWDRQDPRQGKLCDLKGDQLRYIYEGLGDKRQVRLIRIRSRLMRIFLGNHKYELRTFSLGARMPSYKAISYTWGSPKMDRFMILGTNLYLPINETVHDILKELSESWEAWATRWIWIDSICINQSDLKERSLQVGFMREIYSRASETLVCLGTSKDKELVWDMIWQLLATKERVRRKDMEKELLLPLLLNQTSPRFQALLQLFRHPYFQRVWIIQEIVVSKNIQVLYGGSLMPLEALIEIDAVFQKDKDVFLLDGVLSSTSDPFIIRQSPADLATLGIISGFRKEFHQRNTLEIHYLLDLCVSFKATDPRDKVFALLGISAEAASHTIKVDYSRSVSDVYVDVAHYLIGRNELFEVLQWAGTGYSGGTEDIPSWVPDWNSGRLHGPLGQAFITREMNYRSAVDVNADISVTQNPGKIVIAGKIVDCISRLGNQWDYRDNREGVINIATVIERCSSCYNQAAFIASRGGSHPYPNGQTLSEAFWRTLIGDRDHVEGKFPISGAFKIYYNAWVALLNLIIACGAALPFLLTGNIEANLSTLFPQFVVLAPLAAKYMYALSGCIFSRRFCATASGYIGAVPPGSRPEDRIVIFKGAQTPFVVRRKSCISCPLSFSRPRTTEDRCLQERGHGSWISMNDDDELGAYELIGECYIHGMMDGEVEVTEEESEGIELS